MGQPCHPYFLSLVLSVMAQNGLACLPVPVHCTQFKGDYRLLRLGSAFLDILLFPPFSVACLPMELKETSLSVAQITFSILIIIVASTCHSLLGPLLQQILYTLTVTWLAWFHIIRSIKAISKSCLAIRVCIVHAACGSVIDGSVSSPSCFKYMNAREDCILNGSPYTFYQIAYGADVSSNYTRTTHLPIANGIGLQRNNKQVDCNVWIGWMGGWRLPENWRHQVHLGRLVALATRWAMLTESECFSFALLHCLLHHGLYHY